MDTRSKIHSTQKCKHTVSKIHSTQKCKHAHSLKYTALKKNQTKAAVNTQEKMKHSTQKKMKHTTLPHTHTSQHTKIKHTLN